MKRTLTITVLLFISVSLLTVSAHQEQDQSWYISEQDLKIKLPNLVEKDGDHPIEIIRHSGNEQQARMLKQAEAVYPSKDKISWKLNRPSEADSGSTSQEPLWWEGQFDNVRITHVVTAAAALYYYDMSVGLRGDPQYIKGYPMSRTSLKYMATIKYYSQYTHGERRYNEVYVALLELNWSQYCGGLCGMSFSRKKEVVLDSNGDIVGLYLDAPENYRMTVS